MVKALHSNFKFANFIFQPPKKFTVRYVNEHNIGHPVTEFPKCCENYKGHTHNITHANLIVAAQMDLFTSAFFKSFESKI